MPFHVELRDGRDSVRAFNLDEDEVRRRFIAPLRAGVRFSFQDKEFEPRDARLVVVEGARLSPGELGLGQGWTNARQRGTDVTQRFLTESHPDAGVRPTDPTAGDLALAGRLRERILGRLAAGPLPLGDSLGLTDGLLDGHRVSARLAAVETVVWELLHHGHVSLHVGAGADPLSQDQWEGVVLDPAAWLAPGPGSPVISATA